MPENRVVIYSNGIADFQRCYEVSADAAQRISIPVRQDHLADVLASFNVYGQVALESPPTFRPSNELEGNISIDPQRVLEDLATNLSGARVRIERTGGALEGTLVGLHQEEEATTGEPIHPKSVIILAEDGLRRCLLREIQAFNFLDEDVQTEVDKALQRNYQRIKPNSTFVELELSASEETTTAIVQYTIPAAAWKISYRLRMTEGRVTEMQGFAIVDNNTDEDWTDFRICVVTGEPITFSTDLAESKSPARRHVNLVSESALGAVEVEGDVMLMAPMGGAAEAAAAPAMSMRKRTRGGRDEEFEARIADYDHKAEMSTADVHEVGDFSMFESDGLVTIPAKRSTVIPVFNVELSEARSVLHYKHENHPERPYRSIDFKNQTGFSLGRGICTVYTEAAYAGNCIVPVLKPDESRLLPHALETGASIKRDCKRQRTKVVALRLSEGFCYTSTRQRCETHYHIKNASDQETELVLDHDTVLAEPDVESLVLQDGTKSPIDVSSKLTDGLRYTLKLSPHAELIMKVIEQRIDQSQMELVKISKQHQQLEIGWLEKNLVLTNGPLAQDPGVQACLKINQDLEDKLQEISAAISDTERLAARQERLRQNIKAGGQDELANRWRGELDQAEQEINRIEDARLPALRAEENAIRARLQQALTSLSAEWTQEKS